MTRALVLAGGGVAGIAWETGVLRGIEEADPQLAASLLAADVIIGTSAGAAVAAQVTSGRSLADLYDDQVNGPSPEIDVQMEMDELIGRFIQAVQGADSRTDVLRRIGRMAAATETVTEAERRAVIERRLPSHDWPDGDVRIVAVEIDAGEPVVFDRTTGVALVDAVAASCAVPGIWPPVTIGDRRYMDGGVRSTSNVDLAAGCDRIVVLSPAAADQPGLAGRTLAEEVASFDQIPVTIIDASPEAVAAFGTNPLSATTRRPAATAGRRQGLEWAGKLGPTWAG
ncbi:MAG TPA: patatin-like phospholipase family protein [Acidimicrobiales bacterium]|nr:patatin-like phospholipase family protein [Acidimicrobiales bacterium]